MCRRYRTTILLDQLWERSPKTDVWRLFPRLFTINFIFGIYLGVLCFRPEKSKFLVEKKTRYIFPWTRDSQCKDSSDSLPKNTPNASKNVSPICLPKPKSFEFFKRSSLWESVVRVPCDTHTDRNFVVEFDTWAKLFLDLTFCRHSNASSEYSG